MALTSWVDSANISNDFPEGNAYSTLAIIGSKATGC